MSKEFIHKRLSKAYLQLSGLELSPVSKELGIAVELEAINQQILAVAEKLEKLGAKSEIPN